MNTNRSSTKSRIEQLVRYFEQNIHQLKSPAFNETQARQQLIDPLFEALGWDVTNRSMKPLYLQEVVPEGRVKTSSEVHEQHALFETKHALGKDYKEYASILDYIAEDNYKASAKEAIKKPDYRFRIKGQTKFFVEAKKPFVDLAKSQDAIFQVKRYGFSGRVPVSILTDFEEFRVFDCTHRPLYEKPTLGVIKNLDLSYKQYRDQFDLLYDTFAREAVEAGSLDSLTKKLLNKRTGDFALDKTFLEDLSIWREDLARDIAKHPKNRRLLNDVTLNESVQRILDRIVFFRVCEDREIEVENTLLAIVRMWKERPGLSLYSQLNELFKKRRELYNGLLFSPHECEQLEIGDKVILKILENLNYPFSPYHFNEIGVEILGSIYEKFLGKTIHLTAKTVRVDEKPEVRKAGGVYYTPQYIVDYIVANTVGKLLYNLTPGPSPERRGEDTAKDAVKKLKLSPTQVAKLKIIDIACGSGSFLLGAFQKLIDYHAEWYNKNPKDIKTVNGVPDAYTDASGNLRLSSRKKRDILVNNIYGVDIDRQAVEVTQMSLYLKVLEGENSETLNPQMTLALKEVYLPPLADNIKCGNSLIGTDIGSQGELFRSDGSVGARLAASSAGTGQALSLQKINPFDWETEFPDIMKFRQKDGGQAGGFDCVIGNPPYGAELTENERQYLESQFELKTTDTAALMLKQAHNIMRSGGLNGFIIPKPFAYASNWEKTRQFLLNNIQLMVDCGKVWNEVKLEQVIIVVKKDSLTKTYASLVRSEEEFNVVSSVNKEICRGFGFILNGLSGEEIALGSKIQASNGVLGNLTANKRGGMFQDELGNRGSIKVLGGKQINRYSIVEKPKGYVGRGKIKDERSFIKNNSVLAQNIVAHIQNPIDHIKITATVVPDEDIENYVILDTINQIQCKDGYSNRFILGLLCSTLMNWFVYRFIFAKAIRTMHFDAVVTDRLPISPIDFTNPDEKQLHDDMVALVEKMLELNEQIQKANFDSEREPIERQIAATDRKIDQLVYKLYGLTEDEIKIVEEGNKR